MHRDQARRERERAVHEVQPGDVFGDDRGGVLEARRLHHVLGRDLDVVLRQLGVQLGDDRVVVGGVRDGLGDGVGELLEAPPVCCESKQIEREKRERESERLSFSHMRNYEFAEKNNEEK